MSILKKAIIDMANPTVVKTQHRDRATLPPSQVLLEKPNSAPCKRLQFEETVDNGMKVLRLSKILEGYRRGEVHLIASLSCEMEGHRNIALHVGRDGAEKFLRHSRLNDVRHDGKLAMFILPVHVMDNPDQKIRTVDSVVRLKLFNGFSRVKVKDSLYFSVITGDFVFLDRRLFEDRKLDSQRVVPPLLTAGELPRNMVKARPKMVNDFSREHGEAERYSLLSKISNRLHHAIKIVLFPHSASVFLVENLDLPVKIEDVVVGPL